MKSATTTAAQEQKEFIKNLDVRIDWTFIDDLKKNNPKKYSEMLRRGRAMLGIHNVLQLVE